MLTPGDRSSLNSEDRPSKVGVSKLILPRPRVSASGSGGHSDAPRPTPEPCGRPQVTAEERLWPRAGRSLFMKTGCPERTTLSFRICFPDSKIWSRLHDYRFTRTTKSTPGPPSSHRIPQKPNVLLKRTRHLPCASPEHASHQGTASPCFKTMGVSRLQFTLNVHRETEFT